MDSGPGLECKEYTKFCDTYSIRSVKSSAYYPYLNGQAERRIKKFKNNLKKDPTGDINKMVL